MKAWQVCHPYIEKKWEYACVCLRARKVRVSACESVDEKGNENLEERKWKRGVGVDEIFRRWNERASVEVFFFFFFFL